MSFPLHPLIFYKLSLLNSYIGKLKGDKYVGEFRDGYRNGQGTFTWSTGSMYVGVWKDNILWTGIGYDNYGNIDVKYVNGKTVYQ